MAKKVFAMKMIDDQNGVTHENGDSGEDGNEKSLEYCDQNGDIGVDNDDSGDENGYSGDENGDTGLENSDSGDENSDCWDEGIEEVSESCTHYMKGRAELKEILLRIHYCLQDTVECAMCKLESGAWNKEEKGGEAAGDEYLESNYMWVCLVCEDCHCGGSAADCPLKHAYLHFLRTKHPWAVQFDNPFTSWCFVCKSWAPVDLIAEGNDVGFDDNSKQEKGIISAEEVKDVGCGGSSKQENGTENEREAYMVKGLMNLGNTCFFNSVLQNLLALDVLRNYLERLDCKLGPLSLALKELFVQSSIVEESNGVLVPVDVFECICDEAPQFKGHQQQDSHELFEYLLDLLRLEETSNEQDNLVEAIFGGQFCSTISCGDCGHKSLVYEPFFDLSLPIPLKLPSPGREQISYQKHKLPDEGTSKVSLVAEMDKSCVPASPALVSNGSDRLSSSEKNKLHNGIVKRSLLAEMDEASVPSPNQVTIAQCSDIQGKNNVQRNSGSIIDACDMEQMVLSHSSEERACYDMELDPFTQKWCASQRKLDSTVEEINRTAEKPDNETFARSPVKNSSQSVEITSDLETETGVKNPSSCIQDTVAPFEDTHLTVKEVNKVIRKLDNEALADSSVNNSSEMLDISPVSGTKTGMKNLSSCVRGSGASFNQRDPFLDDAYEEAYAALDEMNMQKSDKKVFADSPVVELNRLTQKSVVDSFSDLLVKYSRKELDPMLSSSNNSKFSHKEIDYTIPPVSVYNCLDLFTNTEILSDEHAWHCDSCSENLPKQNGEHRKGKRRSEAINSQVDGGPARSKKSSPSLDVGFVDFSEFNPFGRMEGIAGLNHTSQNLSCPLKATVCGNSQHQTEANILSICMNDKFSEVDQVGKKGAQLLRKMDPPDDRQVDEIAIGSRTVKRAVTKSMLINTAPIILAIHFKRFCQDLSGSLHKLKGHIKFPQMLNLRPYMDESCVEKCKSWYRLMGVVVHSGSMISGHYIAYVRSRSQDKTEKSPVWLYASDNVVKEVSLSDVLQSEAYILFYERM